MMPDKHTPEQRSYNMARVRNKNTAPEVLVRKILHHLGYRFRLHRHDLPGHPDIVLPKYRTVVFVHGCFWHSHNCAKGKRPATRTDFWDAKLDKNLERDRASQALLEENGWRVIVVWECETRNAESLERRLAAELLPLTMPDKGMRT
jgi:DNA mismatch endonuclease (patch repair protein)